MKILEDETNSQSVIRNREEVLKMKSHELYLPEIEVQNLTIDFGEVLAVDDVSFKIEKGELVTLLGPSGSGKTTVLNAIAGLITATSGSIYFAGANITKASPQARKLGFVFQNYALYPHMSVYHNIQFPLKNDREWQHKMHEQQSKLVNQKHSLIFLHNGATSEEVETYQKKLETLINKPQEVKEEIARSLNLLSSQVDLQQGKINNLRSTKNKKLSALQKDIQQKVDALKKVDKEKKSQMIKTYSENYKKQKDALNKEFKEQLVKMHEKLKVAKNATKENPLRQQIRNLVKERFFITKKLKTDYRNYEKVLSAKYSTQAKKEMPSHLKGEIDKLNQQILPLKKIMHNAIMDVSRRVDIINNLSRKPTKLSGGQQQRVAIARAIVKQANVLLMDEPLSNLDAKLRVQTRQWIKEIQNELGITTVFVTHDQEEAMSISDKIICMSTSKVQQIGTPIELYKRPANLFVAKFLGVPEMNIFQSVYRDENNVLTIEKDHQLAKKIKVKMAKKAFLLGIRAEDFREVISQEEAYLSATIDHIEFLGKDIKAVAKYQTPKGDKNLNVLLRRKSQYQIGETIFLKYNLKELHLFDFETKKRVAYELF